MQLAVCFNGAKKNSLKKKFEHLAPAAGPDVKTGAVPWCFTLSQVTIATEGCNTQTIVDDTEDLYHILENLLKLFSIT